MITSKQRAKLKSLANPMETNLQIGKRHFGSYGEAGERRPHCPGATSKLLVLETAPAFAQETAQELAALTGSEVVQVIGTRIVLYRRNDKDPKIEL